VVTNAAVNNQTIQGRFGVLHQHTYADLGR